MCYGAMTEHRCQNKMTRQANQPLERPRLQNSPPDADDGNFDTKGILPESRAHCFHQCRVLLFQSMAMHDGFTPPPAWLRSRTTLIYDKGNLHLLDSCRPAEALASEVHKLWTGRIVEVAIEFVERKNILRPSQEGLLRSSRIRSFPRAVAAQHVSTHD